MIDNSRAIDMSLIQDELVECSLMSPAHSQMWGLNYLINIMDSNYVVLWSGFTHSWESYPRSNTTILHITFLFRYLDLLPNYITSHYFLIVILFLYESWLWFILVFNLYQVIHRIHNPTWLCLDIESWTQYPDQWQLLMSIL